MEEDKQSQSVSPPSSPTSTFLDFTLESPRISPHRFRSSRRRLVIAIGSILSVFSLLVLAYLSFSPSFTRPPPVLVSEEDLVSPSTNSSANSSLVSSPPVSSPQASPVNLPSDRKAALLGPPTDRFRGTSSSRIKLLSQYRSFSFR
jgi:hypothetical protein